MYSMLKVTCLSKYGLPPKLVIGALVLNVERHMAHQNKMIAAKPAMPNIAGNRPVRMNFKSIHFNDNRAGQRLPTMSQCKSCKSSVTDTSNSLFVNQFLKKYQCSCAQTLQQTCRHEATRTNPIICRQKIRT